MRRAARVLVVAWRRLWWFTAWMLGLLGLLGLAALLDGCALVAARSFTPAQVESYLEILEAVDAKTCVYLRGGGGAAGVGGGVLDLIATTGTDMQPGDCLDDLRPTLLRLDPSQVDIIPRFQGVR